MFRSFRLVCSRTEIPKVETLLEAQGLQSEPEPFSPWCRKLIHEPVPLGASLAARFGLIYIQDRASMLPPLALAPQPGAAVLDMCASPGGKSSFLAQLAGSEGFVLANEPNQTRLATLRLNLARLNLPQVATSGYKGQELPLPVNPWRFILLDPPCSGWGTAEKNHKVLSVWRPEKLGPLITLQRELLTRASLLLAPGGRLLFSTCTTNPDENEAQVVWTKEELGLELLSLPEFPGFSFHEPALAQAGGTLRVNALGSGSQGHYLALFAKPGQPPGPAKPGPGCAPLPRNPGWAWDNLPPGGGELEKDHLIFLPESSVGFLPPKHRGWPLGRLKNGRFFPRSRARVLLGGPEMIPRLDVEDIKDLTALLEGQSLRVDGQPQRLGLFFKGLPLGFLTVKAGRTLWSEH